MELLNKFAPKGELYQHTELLQILLGFDELFEKSVDKFQKRC